jgi:hypothetical protein
VLKSVNAGVSYCLKVYYCAVQLTQTKTHTMTTSKNFSKNGKAYNALLSHCNKQYKNVAEITKAYIISGQVYAIDYISTIGKQQIASNTAIAESVITFK